ncbi:MAG: cysteine desulfurase [Alphaproteobacteria bacterium]|nr:cysteine desulfurase [Alphaproteobacteria bacterium]MCB9697347.1 cysteine desulfurase [Alphaproteobacteria bacterium]
MADPILLDHNATTPVLPEVLDAMLPWLRDGGFGNPSSDHPAGRRARAAVEGARSEVAAALGGSPEGVVFTGSGTEADNLAVIGTCGELAAARIVTTAIEHPAVEGPCARLEGRGATVVRVRPGPGGRVAAEDLVGALSGDTTLATVMLANNETGVLQPVAEVGAAARALGIPVHTDAAQAVGRVPIDVDALDVDLVTVVGHKIGAPKGVGALWVRPGLALRPVLVGGGQERGLRPGTENVAGIVALGVACRLAREGLEARSARVAALRDRLEALLRAGVPGLRVTGEGLPRLCNTLHVRFPGVTGPEVLARAPGVAASTGSACHAGTTEPSGVLVAMGLDRADALGAVRLSIGPATTADEIERAGRWLVEAWRAA